MDKLNIFEWIYRGLAMLTAIFVCLVIILGLFRGILWEKGLRMRGKQRYHRY